jgi:chemotaxis protein histidine kinase CheA
MGETTLADPNQYLRLRLGDASFVLPSGSGFNIEQRESMTVNESPDGNVVAWRMAHSTRLPAYCLDAMLRATRHRHWQRAVFLDAKPNAVGLVVDEVQMLPRAETVISPFTPLGLPPTRAGHLFTGAWVTDNRVALVFNPAALVAYLQSLGEQG